MGVGVPQDRCCSVPVPSLVESGLTMDSDLETLAIALYVTTDDLLKAHPEIALQRPAVGISPVITDAEVITMAVMQTLLGHTSA